MDFVIGFSTCFAVGAGFYVIAVYNSKESIRKRFARLRDKKAALVEQSAVARDDAFRTIEYIDETLSENK